MKKKLVEHHHTETSAYAVKTYGKVTEVDKKPLVEEYRGKHARPPQPETLAWLMHTNRQGQKRIEILGWRRLAKIYYANQQNSPIRKAIETEARKCGYTPSVILGLHA